MRYDGSDGSGALLERTRATPIVRVDDTTEVRWFASGTLPAHVVAWFGCEGRRGALEERCDTYRLDGRADIGVKRRFGHRVELKRRTRVGPDLELGAGLTGRIEEWRRWSPAGHLVAGTEHDDWVAVAKAIFKRRFGCDGHELPVSRDLPPEGGCDLELVAIDIGSMPAWSFAAAAFGPPDGRRDSISTAWTALVDGRPSPDELGPAFGWTCGYPEWLARHRLASLSATLDSDLSA